MKRVVITGISAITALGNCWDSFKVALEKGENVAIHLLLLQLAAPELLVRLQTRNHDVFPRVELLAEAAVALWRQKNALFES